MDLRIKPGKLSGEIDAISSKSDAHRILICSFLSKNETHLRVNIMSEDIMATIGCIKEAGCPVEYRNNIITIKPKTIDINKEYVFDCNESGSTLRFLIPIAAALGMKATFVGKGRLPKRPLSPLLEELEAHGVSLKKTGSDYLPLALEGKLSPGTFKIAGNVSSQFVTGLLFALPLLQEESKLIITPPVESRPYIDMTLHTLKKYGIKVQETRENDNICFYVNGGQKYTSLRHIEAEGDWSNAAFWFVAGALSEDGLVINGLDEDSLQGDKYIVEHVKNIGADVARVDGFYMVKRNSLAARDVDASKIPDLVPIIATLAAVSKGTTRIYNAYRLRIKESDRLKTVAANLSNLGADITELEDGLVINGKDILEGGITDSYNDHRIAMSMAIAACMCKNDVIIKNAEAVNKSYPTFFEDFKKARGVYDVIQLW